MRKPKPVVILLSVQLIFAIALAFVNPVKDYLIRKNGTEYTFATQEAFLTGNFIDSVTAECHIKYGFDYDRFEFYPQPYAIIETDENGLAYISALSDTPPESGDWLGTEKNHFYCFNFYSKELDFNLYENALKNTDLFDESFEFSDKYEITVNISVYKGETVLNAILINGVEIGEFLENI